MNYGNCKICGVAFLTKNKIKYGNNIIKMLYCDKCVQKKQEKTNKLEKKQTSFELFIKSDIPQTKQSITLNGLTQYHKLHHKIINQLKFWLSNRKEYYNGPFFYGNSGTGKTTLTYALANHFITNELINVFYLSIPYLLEQKRFNDSKKIINPLINFAKYSQIVILDDLTYNINNIYNVQLLYSIIDERLKKRKTTIITSQLSPSALLKLNESNDTQLRYAIKALIDRCIELCNPIEIGNKNTISIRLLKAKERINNFKSNYESTQTTMVPKNKQCANL